MKLMHFVVEQAQEITLLVSKDHELALCLVCLSIFNEPWIIDQGNSLTLDGGLVGSATSRKGERRQRKVSQS